MRKATFFLTAIFIFVGSILSQQRIAGRRNYYIEKIYFLGNEHFSDKDLKKVMLLKEKRMFSRTVFNRKLLELDKLAISNLYIRNGFLGCTVLDSISVEGDVVNVYFVINEGIRYYLESLEIEGVRVFKEEYLRTLFDIRRGEPYNQEAIQKGVNSILELYLNGGYVNVKLKDSISVQDSNRIKFLLRIREGKRYAIDSIIIRGLKRVDPFIVRREMVVEKGTIYSKKKIELSRRYIYETGLFSSVNISVINIDTIEKKLDLLVSVRELELRYLGVSVGLGQDRGISEGSEPYTSFYVSSEWLHRYLTKKGARLSLKLESSVSLSSILNRPRVDLDVDYAVPWLFGFRSLSSVRTFFNNQIQEGEEKTEYGQEYSLAYKPSRRRYIRTFMGVKNVIYSYKEDATIRKERARENSLGFNVYLDRRDNFLYPSKGMFFTLSSRVVGMLPGSSLKYYKIELNFSRYIKLFKGVVLAYRVKGGVMDNIGVSQTPAYEQFFLGGETSLRGWVNRYYLVSGDLPLGGNLKVLFNTELRFPLIWIIGGEIFLDSGDLQSDISYANKIELSWDAGVGLTFATPLGPFRVDFARVLKSRTTYSKRWVVQFATQYAF